MSVRIPVREPPTSVPGDRVGLPEAVLDDLGIGLGDSVTVEGARRVAAPVVAVDDGARAVFLPERLRRTAGLDPSETATVAPSALPVASSVTLRLRQSVDLERSEDAIRRRLDRRVVAVGDAVEVTRLGGALTLRFDVRDVAPSSPAVVGDETEITVADAGDPDVVAERPDGVGTGDGFVPTATFDRLRDAVATRFDAAETFESAGSPTLGLLLHGPRGSGKTTLVEAVAAATDATLVRASAARLRGERASDRSDRLDQVVEAVPTGEPTVVLLDDFEALGADDGGSALADRFRSTVDELRAGDRTVVIGVTTDPSGVPSALRRGGRFDREVEVEPLTAAERATALEALCAGAPLAMDVDLEAIAARLNGYVFADLGVLTDAALERAVGRDGRAAIRMADFEAALDDVEPSGLREVTVEFPAVGWDEVGGLDDAKRELVRAVYWPLEYADRFAALGIEPPSGVLLYGPPGTGKTLLARAAASLSDANFIPVNGPELLDKYVGESEKAVRDLFATARENAPAVVFFDEVDAISPKRRGDDTGAGERVVSQLLTELDGLEPLTDVAVIAATNRPESIDEALLRPGRIEKAVETPLPDREARREILRIHAREMPVASGVDLDSVADRAAGYSGGDIAALVREAGLLAIEDAIVDDGPPAEAVVGRDHFERALAETSPSTRDGKGDAEPS
ncbi:AAA family ATPase protein [Halorubrum californiense DSM 19288]|uniref:AAA family ATPase protein n=1 Tax=Halorubrum californiense DSM 19288 TaxID=1227465 RepID=M0EMV7_9EURY|nr:MULTISPECIES: AAA family ATPase [Halorubrum]ELZ48242.1 AAA family ATPase protein [Halorubrum californiense DSM 19288]TKX68342.1 AAA family ATPase [Halorubrum sp. GN11GM_10-3_MGM]